MGTSRTSTPRNSRAAASAPSSPGCSSSLVRISSPACELEAADEEGHALAGAGGQRDVVGVGAEQRRVGVTQRPFELAAAFEVRGCASVGELALELALGCLHGARGQRSVGAGVEIRDGAQDGKLLAQPRQAHKSRE